MATKAETFATFAVDVEQERSKFTVTFGRARGSVLVDGRCLITGAGGSVLLESAQASGLGEWLTATFGPAS